MFEVVCYVAAVVVVLAFYGSMKKPLPVTEVGGFVHHEHDSEVIEEIVSAVEEDAPQEEIDHVIVAFERPVKALTFTSTDELRNVCRENGINPRPYKGRKRKNLTQDQMIRALQQKGVMIKRAC